MLRRLHREARRSIRLVRLHQFPQVSDACTIRVQLLPVKLFRRAYLCVLRDDPEPRQAGAAPDMLGSGDAALHKQLMDALAGNAELFGERGDSEHGLICSITVDGTQGPCKYSV